MSVYWVVLIVIAALAAATFLFALGAGVGEQNHSGAPASRDDYIGESGAPE